jgi:hypothetical protein
VELRIKQKTNGVAIDRGADRVESSKGQEKQGDLARLKQKVVMKRRELDLL